MKNKWLRDDLQSLVPYKPNQQEYLLKLDANESPFNLPEEIKKSFCDWFMGNENLKDYPDSNSGKLRNKLSDIYNVNAENMVCGVGSDQLIDIITKAVLNKGDYVIAPNPSFSMYQIATELNYGNFEYYNLGENFEYSVDEILNLYKKVDPKIIFICNPNNPTGGVMKSDDIEHILKNVNALVVVDEAYCEFTDCSVLDKIDQYDNLVVLRTFSKAFGMAGARVGFAAGSKDIVDAMNIVKAPFNLPTMSQFLAIQVLDNYDKYMANIEIIKENRAKFIEKLEELDFLKVYESEANFVFIKSKKKMYDALRDRKYLIRKITFDGYDFGDDVEFLRITIGKEEDMNLLFEIIRELFS